MMYRWGAPEEFSGSDVYRDWFDHVYRPGQSGALGYEIVLVKVKPSGSPASVASTLKWLAKYADEATAGSDFIMDDMERSRLSRLIGHVPADPPDLFLHRRRDVADFADKYSSRFDVLPDGAGRPEFPRPARPYSSVPPAPIVAVIDDGIGFLNSRFTRPGATGALTTRLQSVWLQSEDRLQDDAGHLWMRCGRVLDCAWIDGRLAQGDALDESAEYAALNQELFGHHISPVWKGITDGAGTAQSVTHGTHVMDVAAGCDPLTPEPVADCPMLAVQLPPQAVEDTSGTKLGPYIVRALRWIIDEAAKMTVNGVARPLIVNISIGVLAGSKDGTSFLERQVAAEVLRREHATAMPLRVVFAFGNDRLTRQTGWMELNATPQKLTLRLQSEDYTPSFLELRPERPGDFKLRIEGMLAEPLALGHLAPGEMVSLSSEDGVAVARIYVVPPRNLDGGGQTRAWFLLALAPTATFQMDKPLAPSGAWQVMAATQGDAQALRIAAQRDDRPMGFQPLARQSYLDDPELWQWQQPEKRPYTPTADGPVTTLGCSSAYVSAEDISQVYAIGAALSDTGFAAPYTAVGAPYLKPQPDVSAIGDSSWTLRGVMASGTLSGTTAVVSGTSVAAPQITRQLALVFASGADIGPWKPPGENRTEEMAALAALEWSFVPTFQIDQLGAVNVSREDGLRGRLDDGLA